MILNFIQEYLDLELLVQQVDQHKLNKTTV